VIAIDLRPGPSANVVLVHGERPVLVDSGSGGPASIARLSAFLVENEVAPSDLAWLALTHFHADHAGGASALGVPIAAHEAEAALVNTGDPRAGDPWLGFDIPPYRVDRALADGDWVEGLQVIHTPGQTPGHVAYWLPDERVAITGDLLQAHDVAWVPFGGPWAQGALDTMIDSVRRIADLDPVRTIPGHGPPVDDVPAAVDRTLERYEHFRTDPSRAVWHAVRRALISHLMIRPRTPAALAALLWPTVAAVALGLTPLEVIERAAGALAERGAVIHDGDTLVTTVAHE
jgi:glyoxylase-like metal-dependent hydrolase (beta-lactamase superfamily II)